MSILAADGATTAPSATENLIGMMILASLPLGLLLGWASGIFRRREDPRVDPDLSIRRLLLPTLVGAFSWFGTVAVYVKRMAGSLPPGEEFDPAKLTSEQLAMLSIVPQAVAFLMIVIADRMMRQDLPGRLGYALRRFPRGLFGGVIAAMVVLPIVWTSSLLLQLIYRMVEFKHPSEHELLGAMKEAPVHVKAMLTIGACVVAPVFEEFMFRGHIQVLLVRVMMLRPRLIVDPLLPGQPMIWPAIVIASILFALVHAMWMAPVIFVLSLCLGYVYERTGNLWVSVIVHAIFNTANTVIFLNLDPSL